MKNKYHLLSAALLLAGALFSACTNEDAAIDNPTDQPAEGRTVIFTATLAPKGDASRDQSRACSSSGEAQPALAEGKGDDGSQTRAITTGTDDKGKEILNVKWKKDEHIAIRYKKSNNTYARAEATVTKVDASTGKATIQASLTDAVAGEATFIYPYYLSDSNGEIRYSYLYNNQNGLLNYSDNRVNTISKNFDLATGTGTIEVSGTTATVSDNLALENQCCICKFDITINNPKSTVNYYTITIAFNDGKTYSLTSIPKDKLSNLYVAMLPVDKLEASILAQGYSDTSTPSDGSSLSAHEAIIPSVSLKEKKFYRNVPVALNYIGRGKNLSFGNITATNGDFIYQSNKSTPTSNTISISNDATVTINGVNINASGSAGIICNGSANIVLAGSNSVKGGSNYPAVQAGPFGTLLTISGSGSLTATGGGNGAGIGSGYDVQCGSITIFGGSVTAKGGVYAAGIGCGDNGWCGDITISGGSVMAQGGINGAGIGSGYYGECGAININDGSVTAKGGVYAAGIGCGSEGSCDIITISDGSGSATKGDYAPYSIGKGANSSSCGNITIGTTNYGTDGILTNPFIWSFSTP